MKLSELNTDQALDVLCELTPYVDHIVSDNDILSEIGKVENFKDGITQQGLFVIWAGRISRIIPVLLKTHRTDVYGILSIINEKTVGEIAAQPISKTIKQAREIFRDPELLSFFKSSVPQEKSEQSAPSADSLASA